MGVAAAAAAGGRGEGHMGFMLCSIEALGPQKVYPQDPLRT